MYPFNKALWGHYHNLWNTDDPVCSSNRHARHYEGLEIYLFFFEAAQDSNAALGVFIRFPYKMLNAETA